MTEVGTTGRARRLSAWIAIGCVAAALGIAGCGDDESDAGGTDAAAKSGSAGEAKKGLKLAFFSVGSNNSYLKAGIKGAQDAAAKYGASLEVFNGEFDGAKQLNQVMSAVAARKFDGIVLEPNNPQQLCSAAKAVLDADIPLAVTNVPVCDAAYDQPYEGTAAFVGMQSPATYREWFEPGFESASAGTFATLVGPAVHGNTTRAREVLDELKSEYPGWKEVAFEPTEYQASVALTKTETILQKNPDVDVIFSSYGGHTPGIIAALKAAGKLGDVSVYDLGGDTVMFEALDKGELESSLVYLPYEEQYRGVQAVIAGASGLDELDGVPSDGSFWDLTEDPRLEGLSPFATKKTIEKYEAIGLPEY